MEIISSGETKQVRKKVENWFSDTVGVTIDWEDLLSSMSLQMILKKTKPAPYGKYAARFLAYYLKDELAAALLAKRGQKKFAVAVQKDPELLIKKLDEEMAEGGKSKWQHLVAEVVADVMRKNGAAPDEKTVYGSLDDLTVVWDVGALKDCLFQRPRPRTNNLPNIEAFFILALGLKLSPEDANLFLKKVFLRNGFDFSSAKETMIYLALRLGREAPLTYYRSAMEAYQNAVSSFAAPETFKGATGFLSVSDTDAGTLFGIVDDYVCSEGARSLEERLASETFVGFLQDYKAALLSRVGRLRSANTLFEENIAAFLRSEAPRIQEALGKDVPAEKKLARLSDTSELEPEDKDACSRGDNLERYLYELDAGSSYIDNELWRDRINSELQEIMALSGNETVAEKELELGAQLSELLFGTGTKLSNAKRTLYRKTEKNRNPQSVSRQDLLTAVFLARMSRRTRVLAGCQVYPSAQELLASAVQEINEVLVGAGFHELYPVLPYDAWIAYLCQNDDPVETYRQCYRLVAYYERSTENNQRTGERCNEEE